MSLFSRDNSTNLTFTPVTTARVGWPDSDTALFRLLSLSVVLGLLIMMTLAAIFVVRLHMAPAFPGTRIGDKSDLPKMVQALDTLQIPQYPHRISAPAKGVN